MAKPKKAIISCAVTGAIHTPTMSPHLPVTHDQIAEQAIAAAEAGAAILHLHTRDNTDGRPSVKLDDYMAFLPRVKQSTDAVVNITTGGAPTMQIRERIDASRTLAPEMCSLNMGSMNFAFHPLAERYDSFLHDWEKPYIEGSEANIFRNTLADIREAAEALLPLGVKFEHECYDVGHLYNLRFLMDRGLFEAPVFLQFVFGVTGGIGADVDNLLFMKRTADRLFGDDYRWSVLGAGAAQMPLAATALQLGGNVRVGLEDSLFISRGELAVSNAQQVEKIVRIMAELGIEPATPDEAREILGLKGGDKVGF
ncbi:MAG: 3-keto-5-aminohexanoate cleavage protein [Maritimibacter sp.]|nr:3-keto-5-aminohexanoate cleavage protein [Maritimibacter sp.]